MVLFVCIPVEDSRDKVPVIFAGQYVFMRLGAEVVRCLTSCSVFSVCVGRKLGRQQLDQLQAILQENRASADKLARKQLEQLQTNLQENGS